MDKSLLMIFIICILQIILTFLMTWQYRKERAEYIKMLVAKDYTEYKSFENPVRNEKHSTMVKRQQSK